MAETLKNDLLKRDPSWRGTVDPAASPAAESPKRRPPPSSGRRFLSYDDLLDRGIRFSRVHIRRLERSGHFPMHVTLGSGNDVQAFIAWPAGEVETWENQRIAARDAKVEQAGASAG
jgi:predicted DNA-binding transcriptional regulator AlpA